jgi:hypothetical protein
MTKSRAMAANFIGAISEIYAPNYYAKALPRLKLAGRD